jgi:ferredoxin-NADP reductase
MAVCTSCEQLEGYFVSDVSVSIVSMPSEGEGSELLQARLLSLRWEAQGVMSLEWVPADPKQSFPGFEPGSHIDLHLPTGLVRSYSLCNDATERNRYVVAVLKDRYSRGGSIWVHEQLRPGMVLPISTPRNNFPLRSTDRRQVLIAGGIGVTPMLSMLRALVAAALPVDFIYCVRSRVQAAFLAEIEAFAACHQGMTLHCHFDDERGSEPDLSKLLSSYTALTRFYCCGPAPMLDGFEAACTRLGYPHAYIERFSAKVVAPAAAVQACSVELHKSGRVIEVAGHLSVLDALLDAGLFPDHSCKEGVCGACETRILSGEVEHLDSILTKAEQAANKSMMICVSRCKSQRVVLDL